MKVVVEAVVLLRVILVEIVVEPRIDWVLQSGSMVRPAVVRENQVEDKDEATEQHDGSGGQRSSSLRMPSLF